MHEFRRICERNLGEIFDLIDKTFEIETEDEDEVRDPNRVMPRRQPGMVRDDDMDPDNVLSEPEDGVTHNTRTRGRIPPRRELLPQYIATPEQSAVRK